MLMTLTEVFNETTRILGHTTTIADALTSTDRSAVAMRRVLNVQMMKLLNDYEWSYYRMRKPLELFEENPTKDWDYAYTIPDGIVNVLAVVGCNYIKDYSFSRPNLNNVFKIERFDQYTQVLYTNVKEAWGIVVVKPSETEGFPISFGMALAARLAMAIAPQMITNNYFQVKDKLKEACDQQESEAVANDIMRVPQRQPQYSESLALRDQFDY